MTNTTSNLNTDFQLLRQEVKALTAEVRKTNALINGDETPERGIIVRLDRVEQKHKVISRVSWAAASATVGLFVHAVWNLISGAKGGTH